MFFILSKVLFYIAMPATILAACFLYSLFTKKVKHKKFFLITGIVLFLLFTNLFIVNEAFLLWEKEPVKISDLKNYEMGIVLTGVTNHDKQPHDRIYFNKGADRLLHTLQLYRLGKIKKIFITGGSGRVFGEKISEAKEMKTVLLMCHVPDSDIILEPNSANTRENALFTKKILDSLHIKNTQLLITSAFHMRRAKGCFDKAGIPVDEYPVDFYGGDRKWTPDFWLIPSGGGLGCWQILIHEWIGYITYKMLAYC